MNEKKRKSLREFLVLEIGMGLLGLVAIGLGKIVDPGGTDVPAMVFALLLTGTEGNVVFHRN